MPIRSTGVSVYDSYNNGIVTPWVQQAGGTSLSASCWAGLIAIADQGRVAAGATTLDGPSQTLPALYALPASDFHDGLGGDNGTNDNGLLDPARYDEVTGLGTPRANVLVSDLASYQWGSQLVVSVSAPLDRHRRRPDSLDGHRRGPVRECGNIVQRPRDRRVRRATPAGLHSGAR